MTDDDADRVGPDESKTLVLEPAGATADTEIDRATVPRGTTPEPLTQSGPRQAQVARLASTLFDDRYSLEARLGSGGMGEVLACRDRRMGRTVTVKQLKPEVGAAHAGPALR